MGLQLPTGTITFLFTDIEGSTQLAQRFGSGFATLISDHFKIVRSTLDATDGFEVNTTGDGVFAVFARANDALRAASEIQQAMRAASWPEGGDVKVRIGVHTGEAALAEADYSGLAVHMASRIMDAGHGGQVLVGETTRHLGRAEFEYRSLGEHMLRGLDSPVALFQLMVPNVPTDFPPPRTASAIPNNLPTRISSIIGREEDLETVEGLLDEHRLVTLVGPGGVGKTSLAVTVGNKVLTRFTGGVVFIDLSGVIEDDFVVPAVADALNVEDKTLEGVAARIGDLRTLLIFDNFEQVEGASLQVGRLIEMSSGVRVLVTSQVPLRLPGEHRYVVGPLAINGSADSGAVRLFLERAKAANPGFAPDLTDVMSLVSRLDGLPLAIELVAARANLLSASEMLARLEVGTIASTSSAASSERHRSLDSALSWSYSLLDEVTQAAFRRMSVFGGDMGLSAAEEVIGDELVVDPLLAVAELVDRSLLVRLPGSATRFHMLSGIRRFGRQLLEESPERDAVTNRFIEHYVRLADEAYAGFQSDRGEWWQALFDDEVVNLREVLSILHSRELAAEGLGLAGNAWRFFHSRGHVVELDLWLSRFFALPDVDFGDVRVIKGVMARGAVAYWRRELDPAVDDYSRAVDLAKEIGDVQLTADAMNGLATSLVIADREEEAALLVEENKSLYRTLDDRGGLADVFTTEAFVEINRQGLVGLDPIIREAAELYASIGRRTQATQANYARAAVAIAETRFDDARDLAQNGIRQGQEQRDVFLQIWGLGYVAAIEAYLGNYERSGLLVGASESAREQAGGGWSPVSVGLPDGRELLVENLGKERAENLIDSGRQLSADEAVELALEEGRF